MTWATRLGWTAAVVAALAAAAVLLHRHQARRLAEEEALLADMRRKVEELGEVRRRVEEFQRRKAEYEARVKALEALRANPGPRILAVARAAESLGLAVDEMSISGGELAVVYRAPSVEEARRLGEALEKDGVVTRSSVAPRGQGSFALTAKLLPPPTSRPTPRP